MHNPARPAKRIKCGGDTSATSAVLRSHGLRTVCEEADCPNIYECYSRKNATFLVLGGTCTRGCSFCAVRHAAPGGALAQPDALEPEKVARAARELGLKEVVITSVTRDDLPDGGAGHFAKTVEAVRSLCPGAGIEALIPDFAGSREALMKVVEAAPDILGHNVETVPRLYGEVRKGASYGRSLGILKSARSAQGAPGARGAARMKVKSGIMVGLGETVDEVLEVFSRLLEAGCSVLTVGQYLRPTAMQRPVEKYYSGEEFEYFGEAARRMGFEDVMSGHFVRSSYKEGT